MMESVLVFYERMQDRSWAKLRKIFIRSFSSLTEWQTVKRKPLYIDRLESALTISPILSVYNLRAYHSDKC